MQIRDLVDTHFSTTQLAEAIETIPNVYGLLSTLSNPDGSPLWAEKGIKDRAVKIDIKAQGISIIQTSPLGTPAPAADQPDDRSVRMLPTFRHAKMDAMLIEELRGVRSFGTDIDPEDANKIVFERYQKLLLEHRQTKEFLRFGALNGDVYDANGTSLLYNVYTLMEEQQKAIEWDLDNATAVDPIQEGNDELLDHMEQNALGEPVQGIIKICSPGYIKSMQQNKDFREAFKYFANQGSQINPNRQSLRRPFEFKDVIYLRHTGFCSFKKKDGSVITHKFLRDNEAIAIPLGTQNVFRTYFGPAEWDAPGMDGVEMHAKLDPMKLDLGVEMHTFSYQLNTILKPRLVVRCKIKAA